MKIKWVVSSKPTGAYRSFYGRAWPMAWTADGERAVAKMVCEEKFISSREDPSVPIYLEFAHYNSPEERATDSSKGAWDWKRFPVPFATMKEAKAACAKYLALKPDHYNHM